MWGRSLKAPLINNPRTWLALIRIQSDSRLARGGSRGKEQIKMVAGPEFEPTAPHDVTDDRPIIESRSSQSCLLLRPDLCPLRIASNAKQKPPPRAVEYCLALDI